MPTLTLPRTFLPRTFLTGWDQPIADTAVHAKLFGVLASLAWPVVTSYRSDLFHDACFIAEHIAGPCTFHYAVRESGTNLHFGEGWEYLRASNRHVYEIVLDYDDGAWYVTVVEV